MVGGAEEVGSLERFSGGSTVRAQLVADAEKIWSLSISVRWATRGGRRITARRSSWIRSRIPSSTRRQAVVAIRHGQVAVDDRAGAELQRDAAEGVLLVKGNVGRGAQAKDLIVTSPHLWVATQKGWSSRGAAPLSLELTALWTP